MTSFTARVAVADANFFVDYAIEKRISYREAFSEMIALLRQAHAK